MNNYSKLTETTLEERVLFLGQIGGQDEKNGTEIFNMRLHTPHLTSLHTKRCVGCIKGIWKGWEKRKKILWFFFMKLEKIVGHLTFDFFQTLTETIQQAQVIGGFGGRQS